MIFSKLRICVYSMCYCLNQMIHEPGLKFQSKSYDSWYFLRSPELNQMIRNTCFEIPIWIKWFAVHDPIGALRNSESFCNAWFNWFRVSPITTCSLKSLQVLSKLENEWLFWSVFCKWIAWTEWSRSRVWINWSGSSVNDSLNVRSVIRPLLKG